MSHKKCDQIRKKIPVWLVNAAKILAYTITKQHLLHYMIIIHSRSAPWIKGDKAK